MTLSRDALTQAAAIAGAAPHLPIRLGTPDGRTVTVGEHGQGAMCADGFRRLVAAWTDGCAPSVSAVEFEDARFEAGLLAEDGSRYFVTALSATRVAACLRARADWPEEAHATVREDVLLGVSVVQVWSFELGAEALDDVARDAQAACLVEELLGDVAGV
ncbi:hypothetical protein [Demequina pelophila]|uniref:hypothetical protein n=1 Tax=Demequina pelophila TaxID=1638984 RepID=UPI0007852237|nr:hypothetical protein [Demequina pelophila]